MNRLCHPAAVIVHNDFVDLGVPFSWKHDISACIFQHRNKVGEDETLREHIFAGLEQARTLPQPAVKIVRVVSSVTLPEGDVATVKSVFIFS